jgi:Histidine phosphatase superfamily (branch 2)
MSRRMSASILTLFLGQLTTRGFEQHVEYGQNLRQLYVNTYNFLPATINASLMGIRSTDVPRTLASAQVLYVISLPLFTLNREIQLDCTHHQLAPPPFLWLICLLWIILYNTPQSSLCNDTSTISSSSKTWCLTPYCALVLDNSWTKLILNPHTWPTWRPWSPFKNTSPTYLGFHCPHFLIGQVCKSKFRYLHLFSLSFQRVVRCLSGDDMLRPDLSWIR